MLNTARDGDRLSLAAEITSRRVVEIGRLDPDALPQDALRLRAHAPVVEERDAEKTAHRLRPEKHVRMGREAIDKAQVLIDGGDMPASMMSRRLAIATGRPSMHMAPVSAR